MTVFELLVYASLGVVAACAGVVILVCWACTVFRDYVATLECDPYND